MSTGNVTQDVKTAEVIKTPGDVKPDDDDECLRITGHTYDQIREFEEGEGIVHGDGDGTGTAAMGSAPRIGWMVYEDWHHEGGSCLAVCSTKEIAVAFMKRNIAAREDEQFVLDGDVWTSRLMTVHIREFDIKSSDEEWLDKWEGTR